MVYRASNLLILSNSNEFYGTVLQAFVSRFTSCFDILLAAEESLIFPRNVVGLRKSAERFLVVKEPSLYSNLVQLFENMRLLNLYRSCVLFGITIAVVNVGYETLKIKVLWDKGGET